MSRICEIMHIDKYICLNICYNLDIKDIVNLSSTSKKFRNLYEDLGFWRLYLIHRSGLDESFFTSYKKKKDLYKLCGDFYNYELNNDFGYIREHIDIVNSLYLSRVMDVNESNKYEWYGGSMEEIVLSGGLPVIKYIYDNGHENVFRCIKSLIEIRYNTTEGIVREEYYRNVLYIIDLQESIDLGTFRHILQYTNVDIVRNAYKKLDKYPHTNILFFAIDSGDIDIVKYMIEEFRFNIILEQISTRLFEYSIKKNNIDITDYIKCYFNITAE